MADVKRVFGSVATKAGAALKGTAGFAANALSKAAGATTTVVSIASNIDTKSLILVQYGDKVLLIDAEVGVVIAELQINTDLLFREPQQEEQPVQTAQPQQSPQQPQQPHPNNGRRNHRKHHRPYTAPHQTPKSSNTTPQNSAQ